MSMKRSGKDWYNNEREVMELLGLRQVPGSGSSWVAREDGENDHVLCQLKSTDAQSIRIQLQDIHELQVHAAVSHKMPVFAIQFRGSNEVFLLVSPLDARSLADYINNPDDVKIKIDKIKIDKISVDVSNDWKPPAIVGSSEAARERFRRENEEKFKKKENKAR